MVLLWVLLWCCCGVVVVVVVVVVVIVVVLTVCLDDVSVHATKRQAPNYGGRVPRPCTCVQGPKNSPHQLINALMSCSSRRKPRQCNRGSTTVFSTTAHVELSRPAQQGRRSPYLATGESLGPTVWTVRHCLCATTG